MMISSANFKAIIHPYEFDCIKNGIKIGRNSNFENRFRLIKRNDPHGERWNEDEK